MCAREHFRFQRNVGCVRHNSSKLGSALAGTTFPLTLSGDSPLDPIVRSMTILTISTNLFNTMAKTSINIQPMKAGSERHNLRHKELSYIRKDLSHLNESWIDPRYEGKSMSEVREDIARRYKTAVGQKLQKTAQPLREAVVVIGDNTTLEQLRQLATAMERQFGIKTMQIHIHRDEGHNTAHPSQKDEEWKPNLHAHLCLDWTKPNGKSLALNQLHMSQLQTMTAEVLGMERGVSSDVKHLSAVQYKNKKESERSLALQQQNENLQAEIAQCQESNEQLRTENEDLQQKAALIRKTVAELQSEVRKLKITKKGKQAMLMGLNKVTDIFGKSDLLLEKEKLQGKVKEAEDTLALWQGKVEKLKSDLARRTAERDKALQELAECKEQLAKEQKENYRQFLYINNVSSELRQLKRERHEEERAKQPRMYGIPAVVDMSKFNIMEPYQAPPSLHIGIEGYGRISKRAEPEDVRAWRADEISKEELIAKYFSREIEVALARRLSRLKGTRLTAEVKKIENTMFFRLPSILRIQCSMNIPVGSSCSENPNVRHRSREELLRELVDQGYNVNQYKL